MEFLFDAIKYLFLGFFGLMALLVVVAILFGKRIKRKWRFEAGFRDADGKEFGAFGIELSRIEKEEPDYTLKTKFRMRHAALTLHSTVQVYIDDLLVFERMVEKEGRLFARGVPSLSRVNELKAGQTCRVMVGSTEIATAEFDPDWRQISPDREVRGD